MVPALGESVTEATVAKWFKQVGDAVAADEPLVELETDKVTVEVNAPAAGTLTESLPPRAPRSTSARARRIGEGGGGSGQGQAGCRTRCGQAAPAGRSPARPPRPKPNTRRRPRRPSSSPRRASTPSTIAGTGKDGRITKGDALAAVACSGGAPGSGARCPARRARPMPARSACA